MRSSCIEHPKDEPLIVVRRWHLDAAGGHKAAAALISFLEYWHNIKLEAARKARQANETARAHGDADTHDESLIQHHTEEQLVEGLLLFGAKSIRDGIRVLDEDLDFIDVVPNPNPRYRFDKTRHFIFKPERVNAWLRRETRTVSSGSNDPAIMPPRSGESAGPSGESAGRSGENAGTSPETTFETTNEISSAPDGADTRPLESEKPEELSDEVRLQKDEPTAADFVAVLDEDLRGADVPLMQGRKARYGREFREALRGGTDADLLYRACDRIAQRWRDDYYHHKLSVEDAIGDVIGGKRSEPPAGGSSRNGRARGTPDEVIEKLLDQGGVAASMGTAGTDFRRYEPLLRRHDFSRGYPPRSIEIECGGSDSERSTNARRLTDAAGRIRRRLEGSDQRAG